MILRRCFTYISMQDEINVLLMAPSTNRLGRHPFKVEMRGFKSPWGH